MRRVSSANVEKERLQMKSCKNTVCDIENNWVRARFYHDEEDVVDEEAGSATCFYGDRHCWVAMLRVLVDFGGYLHIIMPVNTQTLCV